MDRRCTGQFWDGKSPMAQPVEIVLAPHGVAMNLEGGPQLWWAFEQVQIREEPDRVRLTRGPETLVLEGASCLAEWRRVRSSGRREAQAAVALASIALVAVGLLLCFLLYGFSWMTAALATLMPLKTEETLGRAALESLAPRDKRCLDPAVERIAGQLRNAISDSPYTFRVYVAEEQTVNAFAAPGGYIVIFRGLLDKTRRPEEAAAVLAHEMQHVVHRHSVKGMTRGLSIWLALALLTGDPNATLASIAGTLGSLHYQRADEEQADRDGLRTMEAAGIDPRAMVGMLELLNQMSGDLPRSAKYLSSHPLTEDRIADIRKRASRWRGQAAPLLPGHRWPPDRQACVAESEVAYLPLRFQEAM